MTHRDLNRIRSKAKRMVSGLATSGKIQHYQHKSLDDLIYELRVNDIERQLQYEELSDAREQSSQLARENALLFETSPVGMMITDRSGFIKRVNQQAESMLRSKRGNLIGQTLARFAADPDRDSFHRHINNVFRHNLPQTTTIALTVAAQQKYVKIHSKPHAGVDGQIFSTLEDVTVQHHATQEQSLASAIFAHASDGIIVCDANDIILRVNTALSQLCGYPREDMKGLRWQDFLDDYLTIQKKTNRHDIEVWRDGRTVCARAPSGQKVWLHIHCKKVTGERDHAHFNVFFIAVSPPAEQA